MVHILDTPYTKTGDLYSYHEKRDIHSPSNTLPLLLTSRQASVKTQWTLNRIQKTAYVLDVSVLNEGDMFSTWVSVPQLTTHLSTLHMDMRLFGRMATSNELRPQGSHPDLNHFNCNFYAILDRFLPYGPVNEKKGGSGTPYEDRVITVENFVIDFRSAERNLPFPPRDMGYRDWLTHIANTWHGDQRVDKAPKVPPDTVDYAFRGVGADEFHMWRGTTFLKLHALGFPVVWPQDLENDLSLSFSLSLSLSPLALMEVVYICMKEQPRKRLYFLLLDARSLGQNDRAILLLFGALPFSVYGPLELSSMVSQPSLVKLEDLIWQS
ncbi:hypothetical protein N7527_007461 [Penicillium freii]|uniref:Uncharacterized protein n=1 Tax=Penicillium freii TaxID=48697 RepID=A0A101MK46_PENFR|nr:hypothetical protein N7527_007461 [Penicillium freii]KUM62039.1 hypothetical protein ACN42_g5088 [Penicillium freii]